MPAPAELFEPAPNHDFHAPAGEVQIIGLNGHLVCYTTDGTEPLEAHGSCSGATTVRLPETSGITLACGNDETSASSVHGVKLAFDWAGRDSVTAAGNFVLDCTQPEPDRDGDGVADNRDNCPTTPNADQRDGDLNGIGDACEAAAGAPDADRDGRPDSADNCPNVWNVNQGDDDHDGIGNVCDTTPRGDPPLPWDNEVLARAAAKWTDEVKCTLNDCKNPSAPGSWSASCDGAGTVGWNVGLNGLRAASTFTYKGCRHTVSVSVHDYAGDPNSTDAGATVPMDITLIVDGSMVQDTDFSGNGSESGTITVGGSFTGSVTSHVKLASGARATGSSFSVACTADPIPQEMCAPNNLSVNYLFPDWSCEPGGCPAPPAPLTDRDGDGVFDPYDNCPDLPNPSQANADFDALGDACDPSTTLSDSDHDGTPDTGDNCPAVANPGQEDVDHDGLGDACDEERDLDTDGDGVVDAKDDCPKVANPTQLDSDSDGIGDACDPTPSGAPAFWALKFKIGRCLYADGSAIRSTGACDPTQSNQQWDVLDAGSGRQAFRNQGTMQCLMAASWTGALEMAPCDTAASAVGWLTERYDQGGFDPSFPMRLRSASQDYCLYTDGTGLVYATQWNCGLPGTQDNRKIGLYRGGDFSVNPVQPP